jgi:hypothetical protein
MEDRQLTADSQLRFFGVHRFLGAESVVDVCYPSSDCLLPIFDS